MIGYMLIGCLILLIILLCIKRKDIPIHTVYADDDD